MAIFEEPVFEDTRKFDKTQDFLKGLSYPCIVLTTSAESPIPKSRLQALKGMFEGASVDLNLSSEPINLYFKADKTMLIGKLQSRQIKSFMKLFEGADITGYLSKDKKLEGAMLYVLSN